MSAKRTYTPNERTVEAYTEGDCWHLALVIHRRTGWPMVFARPMARSSDPLYWEHAAILMPDGRVLDIMGTHVLESWAEQWGRGITIVGDTKALLERWLEDQERRFLTDTYAVATRLLASLTPAAPEAA